MEFGQERRSSRSIPPGKRKENNLAELIAASKTYDNVRTHVIFLHGLSGGIRKTWTNAANPPVLWPTWLNKDLPGVGLWLVGYPAAKTNWRGNAMPLADRADNVLARLVVEPRLHSGNIVFVAHSLGGLVVVQLLRSALRDASVKSQVESFLSRVRRVAFLGTPHRGALLANIVKAMSFLVRPSAAINDLPLGDPQLLDLNRWYRRFSQERGIENLVLAEGRPEKFFGFNLPQTLGTIVSPISADPGLPDLPVTVDESHMTICKPLSRKSDVYVHLKEFVGRPFDEPPHAIRIVEALERSASSIDSLSDKSDRQTEAIKTLTEQVVQGGFARFVDPAILDAEVQRQIERLRVSRLFAGFETADEARRMARRLTVGDLAQASPRAKSDAMAWCARFLASTDVKESESILLSVSAPEPELCAVARAFILQNKGQASFAVQELKSFDTRLSRGAAFICMLRDAGFEKANEWMTHASLSVADLDSDAQFLYIGNAQESGAWELAQQGANAATDADFTRTPALLIAAADAHLAYAVPLELRRTLRHIPMEAAAFPLRSEPEYLACRRSAARHYERAATAAAALGMKMASGYASDKALWLRLRDPESVGQASLDLEEGLRDPELLLRRLNLALSFGIKVDLAQAEKEVDRQTALSGGSSTDAAVARFALAFAQDGYAAAAAYVNKHRNQLLEHIDRKGVYFFEIEALAKSHQAALAEIRLQELLQLGITKDEDAWLRRILEEVASGDSIAGRLDSYDRSKSLPDLRLLVGAYEDASNWEKTCEYGQILLAQTGDIEDARRHFNSLYQLERLDEALDVLKIYPALLVRYEQVQLLQAQVLYELGRFDEARWKLDSLPTQSDGSRRLRINLSISSGDWEHLQGFVEEEWNQRAKRSPLELLRCGYLAQHIGAVRGKDFVREAASRSHGDAQLLVGCYQAAVSGGWEDAEQVAAWFNQAAALSEQEDGGPVQKVSIEDLIERQPSWQKRENETWEMVVKGEAPLFTAGQALNRSLLSLFLVPAICNRTEPDVRKRPIVYAFSGARGPSTAEPTRIAMDPTALVTAQLLGILELYLSSFEAITIPHGTLAWLFEERSTIAFHQPSRVAAARELRRLVDGGQLKALAEGPIAPDLLVAEVGEHRAELLARASHHKGSTSDQRLVVCGGPIYRASTFMKDEADLASYQHLLVSTLSVVEKLAQKGLLVAKELADARAAIGLRERQWPSEPNIVDGATLYLDGTAVSHLAHLGLLQKLHRASITAVVSHAELESADALIAHDASSGELLTVVDDLRMQLRAGIESGRIRLGRAVRVADEDKPEAFMAHPSVAILKLVDQVDAAVCDDRYFNQHALIGTKPLLTTLDTLDLLAKKGVVSREQWLAARTALRVATFALVPLNPEELSALVEAAPVLKGALQETAELRAVREVISRVRMSNLVQSPKEVGWLNGILGAVLLTLKNQWRPEVDEQAAIAKSDWLLRLGDVRGWTHVLNEDVSQLGSRFQSWVGLLMVLPIVQPEAVKEMYWRWLDSRILSSIAVEDADTQSFLLRRANELVEQVMSTQLDDSDE